MKKLLAVLFTLALLAGLAACGHFVPIMPGTEHAAMGEDAPAPDGQNAEAEAAFREQPLMDFLGWGSFASSYYDNTPVALSIRVGDSYASPIFDRTGIISACDALRAMTVTDRAGDIDPTAQPTVFTFTMSDGDERSVTFVGGALRMYAGDYTVSGGDALWSILFPGYSDSFSVFDLYYSQAITDFANGFYENVPLSVGRRQNGGATLTSKDPTVISQVFSLLVNARVNRVEESPDQNIDLTQVTDYVFTMPDSTTYTFTFTGPCLTVTASQDYGPVYYWLDGVDELPYLTILPESTIPTFAGGYLSDLREDIAQAQLAAYNEYNGITVIGVYVDYTINGQTGYLTLSGDIASMFVQRVTTITATNELVTPSGENITVSVTLSDGSGPILYFTGDTVQQMVGMNYPCDPNAMATLRNTILELALDSNNVGTFAGESTG